MPLFGRNSQESEGQSAASPHALYSSRLAHIGRLLDGSDTRSVSIIEVFGNFIVRATDSKSGQLVLSEVVEDDFADAQSGGSWSQRSVYEPLLREVGNDLDQRVAANVAIIEGNGAFQVIGWMHGEAAGRATYVRFDRRFTFDELRERSG